ncbi:hypothetical protein CMV_004634 [Castanea mollissima]|uniref:Rab-GAP TBC domain-containing protein n=1 Tax=Castanea mollissima TaxID=60419 RepID=A0A8J4REJ5_9ROSI|nr:hypothetical protein CMV_004634 [Castanea mollissima]
MIRNTIWGSLGQTSKSPVLPATVARTVRKGSAEHLAINVDVESERLINNEGSDEDKDPLDESSVQEPTPEYERSLSYNEAGSSDRLAKAAEEEVQSTSKPNNNTNVIKFSKTYEVHKEKLRELAWSGIPDYMRPDVWRLLLGYAPPNSDRKEGILRRKRLEYLDCVSHYYDIPDTERSDDEINMLRQIAVDCPRTVHDVSFFQEPQVQKSLERICYTWQ